MTKLIALVALFFTLAVGSVAAQEQFAPQVDVSSIETEEDFYGVLAEIDERFYQSLAEAEQKHGENIHQASLAMREADYQNYLLWLDARHMLNWDKLEELERTVPAIAAYQETASVSHQEMEAAKQAARDIHNATKDAARKVRDIEKDAAREAFRAIK